MRNEVDALGLSRRSVLALPGVLILGSSRLWAGSEFWNKKDPADWTGEEIEQLTTRSPWAKQVVPKYVPSQDEDRSRQGGGGGRSGRGGGGAGGRPTIGIGPLGIPLPGSGGNRGGGQGGGGGQGRGRRGGGEPDYKGTVRWESAQPIRAALKTDLPEGFANHYVIGVRDIPLHDEERPRGRRNDDDDADSSGLSKDMQNTLRQATILQLKNGDAVEAALVKQMTPGGTWFLFGFSKAQLDFGKNDHEIDFTTRLGSLVVKAKFELQLMKYRGKLAV